MKYLMKRLTVLLLAVTVALACFPLEAVYASASVPTEDIQAIVDNMTIEQKIAQCLMIDFRKWKDASGDVTDMTVLSDEVAELIADYQLGSIILFANNIKNTEDTVKLTKDMQAAVMSKGGIPMIISTDQEGGSVFRLGSGTALPGNMALAATGDSQNAKIAGEIIGRELSAVGINTTLSPVIDVNSNADNPVIGLRSFSDDPDMVAEYGSSYIRGLVEYGVIGCGKHFPGHGDTATDSHYGLPVVDKSLYSLSQCELIPFQKAIDEGIDMIMPAHILYPQIDDSTIYSVKTEKEESRAATMSHKILTDLLRGDMGFNGVIVADAMNMGGIADYFTMEQATLESLRAGADIITMPLTGEYDKDKWIEKMDRIINTVRDAAESDAEFAESIDESVIRILTLKKIRGILDYDPADYSPEKASAAVGSAENRELEREISAKAVTVVRNENNALPIKADSDTRILLLAPYTNERAEMVMGVNRAKEAGLVPKDAKVWVNIFSGNDYEVKGELEKELEWADVVIINSEVSGKGGMAYGNWTSLGPKAFTEYCKEHGKTSVILSVDKPYDVQLYKDADAIVAVYGCKGTNVSGMPQLIYEGVTKDDNACGPNIAAGVEVAFGVFGASGKLPVDIPVFDPVTSTYTADIAYERGFGITYDKLEPAPVQPVTPSKPENKEPELQNAAIKALTSGRGKLTVKMTAEPAAKGGTYYQVAYRVKGSKKWTYKTTATSKLTIKKLKAGKKYSVRVRTCRNVNGAVQYSAWSKTKTSSKIKR